MFNKNLKYYRLRKSLSKKELAEICHITPMAITNYENGTRQPNMEILKSLANALDIRVADFLIVRNQNISFRHEEFRKNFNLNQGQQDLIKESVEEYFGRFFTIIEVLGGNVLPDPPKCHVLHLGTDIEENALSLRKHLGLAEEGSIDDLIAILENKGILVCAIDIDNRKFSGMNGFVNNRPYIVINKNMSPERNRSTIAHELAHLMFKWSKEVPEKDNEKMATAISGAMLFSKRDAIRELGIRRSKVSNDMLFVCKEYGISMMLLVKRAQIVGIISDSVAKNFFIEASKHDWRINEPSRIEREIPLLFEQLVYRAVNEGDISIQKGAELLDQSYDSVLSNCQFDEV